MSTASHPAPLEITDPQPSHEALVREISDQTHTTHHARFPHRFGPENNYQHFLIDTVFGRDTGKSKDFHCMMRVACHAGAPVGYTIAVWQNPKPAKEATLAVVADIGVTPNAQRQGIATALLADLLTQKDARGWHSLTADVWLGNAASHALFAKAGFTAERTEYLLGDPPPLATEQPAAPASNPHYLWIVIAFLLAIAVMAAVP